MSGTPMMCELTYPERKDDWRPFRVVVHDCALEHLKSDARQALRVYELMCITRPGDVCKYLWVELLDVSADVRCKAAEQRKVTTHPPQKVWPENFVPLVEFDRYFFWMGEDTHAEDACWFAHREGKVFGQAIRDWFESVVRVQQELRGSEDPLVRFEMGAMDARTHPFDVDAEPPFQRTRPDYRSPILPKRTPGYYVKLREMLVRPDMESIAMSGEDMDFQTLRLACTVQRERAEASGKHPLEALPFCVSASFEDWDRGWGTFMFEYFEGLGYGDMWILLDDDSGDHMKWLVEEHKNFHKWFFFHGGAEPIPGYRMVEGEGWILVEDETEVRDYRQRGKASLEAKCQRMRARERSNADEASPTA